jgi:uncharacterized LabA/DUF88 family protein
VGKNVAVFVDVANIFYAAKAAGVDIDYVTLLKSASAGRDLVRAYAYTGLDPDNENQRNFHSFLARNGYRVVSKDIRKYGDGKVKANLDIELVVDMMKTARNLDIAIVVSGDGDFAPAIRAVQEMGVRCEVISFRGNTSSDLMDVADSFTDITQLARVEKGSRSGRRVAEDGEDLSMTEVPDKQTEGSGRGRGGRGRGRDRAGTSEPVAAGSGRGRSRSRTGAAAESAGGQGIVALPGERLSKAPTSVGLSEVDLAQAEVFTLDEEERPEVDGAEIAARDGAAEGEDGAAPRRRRRRGGRGRGRGRGREEAATAGPDDAQVAEDDEGSDADVVERQPAARRRPVRDEDDLPVPPRGPQPTPFGSVWDSQLGTSTPSATELAPLSDEDFDDEPEIPEYLIAERNRAGRGGRGGGRGGGPRGGRSAYQSAISRERFGRGGGGGINRYPDVSERTAPRSSGPREDRPRRAEPVRSGSPSGRGGGEWSEVPPELEELLRAQLGQKAAPPAAPPAAASAADEGETAADEVDAETVEAADAPAEEAAPKRRTRKAATSADAEATEGDEPAAAPKRRTRKAAAADAEATEGDEPAAAPKRRTRKAAASADAEATEGDEPAAAPKRRTRKAAAADAEATEGDEPAATPKRRTRKAAATPAD